LLFTTSSSVADDLPSLGEAGVITTDLQGQPLDNEMTIDNSILIYGGIKVIGNVTSPFELNASAYQDDSVDLQVKFTLPTGHKYRGHSADIFTIGFYSPLEKGSVCSSRIENGKYYWLKEPITNHSEQTKIDWFAEWRRGVRAELPFEEWNGKLNSLKLFKTITLEGENTIDLMVNSKFPPNLNGKLCFTFGYRVTLETNKEEWIFNNTSVDLNFVKKTPLIDPKEIATQTIGTSGGIVKSDQPNTPVITVPAGLLTEEVGFAIISGTDEKGNITWTFITDKTIPENIESQITIIFPDVSIDSISGSSTNTSTRKNGDTYPLTEFEKEGNECRYENGNNWYCSDAEFLANVKQSSNNGVIGEIVNIAKRASDIVTGRIVVVLGDGNRLPIRMRGTSVLSAVNAAVTTKRATQLSSSCSYSNCANKIPVLFVHGFSAGGSLGGGIGTWGTFPNLIKDLDERYAVFEFQWVTGARFQDVAYDLGKSIQQIKDKTGNKVHIIAHSFGGLVTRTYLEEMAQKYKMNDQIPDKLGYGDNVASVTTVGTPHSGIFDSLSEVKDSKVFFPKGQDSVFIPDRISFEGCYQISCYQAGEPVLFDTLRGWKSSWKKQLKLDNEDAGEFIANLNAIPFSNYPPKDGMLRYLPKALPIQVLIGLNSIPNQKCILTPGDRPVPIPTADGKTCIGSYAVYDSYSTVSTGDGLISYEGQRFTPELTSGVKLLDKETKYGGIVTEKILGGFTDTEVKKEPDDDGIVKPSYKLYLTPSYQNGYGMGYKHTDDLEALVYDNYVRKPPRGEVYLQCTSATDCQHDTFLKVKEWLKEWLAAFDSFFTLGFKVKDENESFLDAVLVSGNKLTANSSTHFFEVPVNSKTISEIRDSNPPLEVEISQAGYISKKVSVKADIDALLNKTAVYTLQALVSTTSVKITVVEGEFALKGATVQISTSDNTPVSSFTTDGGTIETQLLSGTYKISISKADYETVTENLEIKGVKVTKSYSLLQMSRTLTFKVLVTESGTGKARAREEVCLWSAPKESFVPAEKQISPNPCPTTGDDGKAEFSTSFVPNMSFWVKSANGSSDTSYQTGSTYSEKSLPTEFSIVVTPTRPVMPEKADTYLVFDGDCISKQLSTNKIPGNWITEVAPLKACSNYIMRPSLEISDSISEIIDNLCQVRIFKKDGNTGKLVVLSEEDGACSGSFELNLSGGGVYKIEVKFSYNKKDNVNLSTPSYSTNTWWFSYQQ